MELIVNIIGWIGAASLLTGYLLISSGKIVGKSYAYQGLNLLGSFGFIVNSYYFGAIPSVALNVIWLFIGIFTVIIMKRNKRKLKDE
ncbi:MAG: hypothetical protein HOH19_01785 [Kordiimonadaceae bacterium]|nr:hypothetical protein [Kordiimonadaceae bacterium]MBT6031280.1 hypothetical protein [Kordiimonadaceae bacterium]